MEFIVKEVVSSEDKNAIYQELLKYNLARIEDKESKDLGIYLEDASGNKIAGIICDTHGNWLSIHYLWVDESQRGKKIGKQLLLKAEKEAKKRGCKYAFVDTFDFQAPGFYIKQGYTEVFKLEHYPISGARFYYTKEL